MRTARRQRMGQAAVEAMFAIPVMAVLFVVGFQLFAITWSAQGAHIRSRYKVVQKADHKPCKSNNDGTQEISQKELKETETINVSGDTSILSGGSKGSYSLKNTSTIICEKP